MLGKIKWWIYPSFPYSVLDVVFPDRIETFYEGLDEIHINSTKHGYAISVIPSESREESPGPITFISSHDPWTIGSLVTPFYLFRRSVILWAVFWFMIIYMLFMYVVNVVLAPPPTKITVPGLGRITIPRPGWSPDPMVLSGSILLIGFTAMYYGFNILRFMQPIIKYSVLITVGSVSGTYYTIPAPEPLTTVKVPDFLKLLGYKMYHFQVEIVSVLTGIVNSLIRENKTLREQALSYDDAMTRETQIDQMMKRFSAAQVVSRFMMTKPLLFMLLITIPLVIGFFMGMAFNGGVGVAPPTTIHGGVNATTTTVPHH